MVGTTKNFAQYINKRFNAIEHNQVCNKILIVALIIWCIVLSCKVSDNEISNKEIQKVIVPITQLEMID